MDWFKKNHQLLVIFFVVELSFSLIKLKGYPMRKLDKYFKKELLHIASGILEHCIIHGALEFFGFPPLVINIVSVLLVAKHVFDYAVKRFRSRQK